MVSYPKINSKHVDIHGHIFGHLYRMPPVAILHTLDDVSATLAVLF